MKISLIKKVFGVAAFAAVLSFAGCAGYGNGDSSSGSSSSSDGTPTGTPTGTPSSNRITPDAPETPGAISMSSESGSLGRAAGGTSYPTITAALAAIPTTGKDTYTITLAPGTYREDGLKYNGSCTVKIVGSTNKDYGTDVLILGKGSSQADTKSRSLLSIEGSGDLILENITLKNNFTRVGYTADSKTQAEALGHGSSGNVIAVNCAFLSHQDTIRTVSKAWFYGCYIEGDVDFLWCEASSIVALYESCSIRALSEESKSAYVAAPKFNEGTNVGKGLVVLNSKVVLEDGLDAYLFRNPWSGSTGYYNSVAYVNTTIEGTVSSKGLAKSAGLGTADQQYVGYKVDSALASKYSSGMTNVAVLSDAIKNVEYNGRESILNRKVNTATLKFAKDADTYWDISSIITKNGFTVAADTSKSLLDGETEAETKIYVFDSDTVPEGLAVTGFAKEAGKTHYQGPVGSTIEVPLKGKALVEVTGYFKGSGTIKAGTQGESLYDFNNGSTSKFATKPYVVYDSTATKCVITAAATTYITKIVVTYDDTLEFKPVTSIAVAANTETPTVGIPCILSATVNPSNATNADVVWSSSDTSVGTVNPDTGAVTFLKTGSVTFKAVARDGSDVSGEITLEPVAATWTKAEWYFTKDASASTQLGKGFGLDASYVAGSNNSAFSTKNFSGTGIGSNKSVTVIDDTSKNISTGLKMDGNGELYISVAKAAKLTVKQAYINDTASSKDYTGYLVIAATEGTATPDASNPTANSSADKEYTWTLTPGSYTVKRYTGNTGPIYYARCDITE